MSLIRGNFIVILMLVFLDMVLPTLRWIAFLWLLLLFITDLIFVRLKTLMKKKEEIRQREIEEIMATRKPWWRKHI